VKNRLDTGMKELKHLIELKGEYVACKEMRKRFCCYSKGVTGGAAVRKEIVNASTFDEYQKIYNSICSLSL
jgi:tRNA-dihydrouridine synthase